MKKQYKWGILGAGRIAAKFASALNYTENAVLFAVASRDGNKARQFAKDHAAMHAYDNYESLLKNAEVDIIYIATPHSLHCEQVLYCLQHGKRVLCEKPMALNNGQVQQMVTAAKQAKVFLMEGMWSAFMPSIEYMMKLVQEDVIGPVQYVRADFGFNTTFDAGSRLYDIKLGGGSLLDVGIYPLFLTTLLMGEPSSIQAVAKLATTGADEYCNILLTYPGGQTANIFSAITVKTSLTAEIAGHKGTIQLHNPWYKTNQVSVLFNNGEQQQFSFPHEHNGFEYEIRHVMDCLDKDYLESPAMPHNFSLQLSSIMDSIRRQCGIHYEV